MTAPVTQQQQAKLVPFMGPPSECFLDPTVAPAGGRGLPALPDQDAEVHACEASPDGDEVRIVIP
ncbi:MAG: hypothetical protein HKN82_06145 [Akkermansiaceae bacterium]|nr:hypothetical protein [Akkermansiaceae bacterium]NNM30276.1 hypothetical protein [Akkermansiaceae bacterium]